MGTKVLISALLVAATVAVYAPIREHRFVDLDDVIGIVANPDLQVDSAGEALGVALRANLVANWVPLTVLSLQLDRALYGGDPTGTLLTNVALHAAASVVLFLALAAMTGAIGPSAFTAAVFALHPLHVESVAWASSRKDVLSGLFWMLTLLAWARYAAHGRPRHYALAAVFLTAGLLSKPVVVTLPFVLLLLDYWPLARLGSRSQVRRAVLEKLPLLLPVLAVCVTTIVFQREFGALPDDSKLSLPTRLANAVDSTVVYLVKSFWPTGLAVFYPHPGAGLPALRVAGAAALLAGLSGAAFAPRRSRPYLQVGWLWYLGTLVPVIGLVQVGIQARADRYTYLPLVGLAIALAWGAAELFGARRAGRLALATIAGAALLALGAASSAQLAHWSNPVALHTRAVEVSPDDPLERARLARALEREQRFDEAIPHYERSAELAPHLVALQFELAHAYVRAERDRQAVRAFERGLELAPDDVAGRANLGRALLRLGRRAAAGRQLELAAASRDTGDGGGARALAALEVSWADLLVREGKVDEALGYYRRALAADPAHHRAGGNVGMALEREGRHAEAIPLLASAAGTSADSAQLQASLARSYAGVGRSAEAVLHYRVALQLRPRWKPAANDLAWILATSFDPAVRNPDEALRVLGSVMSAHERRPEVLDTLAAAQAGAGRYGDAVETLDRALALLESRPHLAAELRQRRALYATQRPYLAPAPPGAAR